MIEFNTFLISETRVVPYSKDDLSNHRLLPEPCFAITALKGARKSHHQTKQLGGNAAHSSSILL